MKSGLMLFFVKREKTKKPLKRAAYFMSHNGSVKIKMER